MNCHGQQKHAEIPINEENAANLCRGGSLFSRLYLLHFHNPVPRAPTAAAPAVLTAPAHWGLQEIGIQRFRDDFLKERNLWLEMRTMNNGRWDAPDPGCRAASAEQEVRRLGWGGGGGQMGFCCTHVISDPGEMRRIPGAAPLPAASASHQKQTLFNQPVQAAANCVHTKGNTQRVYACALPSGKRPVHSGLDRLFLLPFALLIPDPWRENDPPREQMGLCRKPAPGACPWSENLAFALTGWPGKGGEGKVPSTIMVKGEREGKPAVTLQPNPNMMEPA